MGAWIVWLAVLSTDGSTTVSQPPDAAAVEAERTLSGQSADRRLLEAVRELAASVESIRAEAFSRSPLAARADEEGRRAAARSRVDAVIGAERVAARGRAWSDLGLGGEQTPAQLFALLAADLEGVGLDSDGDTLLIADNRLSDGDFSLDAAEGESSSTILMMTGVRPDEPMIAHGLMHVRQWEREGRDRLDPWTDPLLAGAAWAEGEANLVAVRKLFQGMGLADAVIESSLNPGTFIDGRLIPDAIHGTPEPLAALLRFVYVEGFAQAASAYGKEGWNGLDGAMRLRRTTRDVLHSELAGRPLQDVAGPAEPPLEGMRLVDEDSLGEHAVFAMVAATTGKDNLGLIAADGWEGDRLRRWERDGGEEVGVTEWRTGWRTPEDAADFVYALRRSLAARFPAAEMTQPADGVLVCRTERRVFRVRKEGLRVEFRAAPPEVDLRLEARAS